MAGGSIADWQALLGIAVTGFGTWYATSSANRIKGRELARDEQASFMKTVLEELENVKTENGNLRRDLDAVKDEVRSLKAENHSLQRSGAEQLRVLARVATCAVNGCPHAARAAEFGGSS